MKKTVIVFFALVLLMMFAVLAVMGKAPKRTSNNLFFGES
jgi:hypothetical protein